MTNNDEYIGFIISDVARLMRTVFDRQVRKLGFTRVQWMLLTRLHRRAGATQSELAEVMEVERATAGRLIDRMEKKGWIERRSDPKDRRINRIFLTREAELAHRRIWKIAEATVDAALFDLSARETAQLAKSLKTIKSRLLQMPDGPADGVRRVPKISRAVVRPRAAAAKRARGEEKVAAS